MASTYLQRTNTTPTQLKKYTLSIWFKKGLNATSQYIYSNYQDGNNRAYIVFLNNDKIYVYDKEGGTDRLEMTSNFVCRDVNAWYHIVYAVDYRAGGSGGAFTDRVKFYVNGVNRIADFSVTSSFGYNSNTSFQIGTTSNKHNIGCGDNTQNTFDGSMSHVNFVDGTQLDASAFGETDATTGEWKIKTSPSVTYGNNGYFILKDGNSVTDQSPNTNNFTVAGGTLTKTEDCPSNVFATLNPLYYEGRDFSFSNGNNTATGTGSDNWNSRYGLSTLGMSSGKYYVEAKVTTTVNNQAILGLINADTNITSSFKDNGVGAVERLGRITGSGSNLQTGLTAWTNGDIAGATFDATNGTLQFYRNGSTYGTAISSIPNGTYLFGTNAYEASGVVQFNFGNGYFGTTAVSSAGTNASGNGIFEYDVPTGYTALSTKGLNL